MAHRSITASLVAFALATLGSRAAGQFTVSMSRTTFELGEPIFLGEKLVNATMLPVPYSTRTRDGANASIQYRIHRLDPENQALQSPTFLVERNGSEVLNVRSIVFHAVSSGFSGEIGPGRSSAMGGTLGFGLPFNLLVAPPTATGAWVELVTAENQVVVLAPRDRIALPAASYQVTALVDAIRINGYEYDRSTSGYLVAEAFFDVRARRRIPLPARAP